MNQLAFPLLLGALAGAHEPSAPGMALTADSSTEDVPWLMQDAFGLPEWLTIKGHQRTRYESLDEQFRASPARSGSDQLFALRTSLELKARFDLFEICAEMLDSRQINAPEDSPSLNTTNVNAVELLQGYGAVRFEDTLAKDDALRVQFGRHTMDVGSRRFVARNRFRNTINAFTGVNATWETAEQDAGLRAFYVIPVQRLPSGARALENNEIKFDEERTQVQFYGLHGSADVSESLIGELYGFGLDETDGSDLPTRNREIWTTGGRFFKKPAAGEFDFELEGAYQFGTSHSNAAPGNAPLNHDAFFYHVSGGYRFEADWKPRVELLFDYATGDDDPTDGSNNRFDTLFGARRFELGPTGIFGAFARSNLITPGIRFTCAPTKAVQVMLAHRFHFLESKKDAWTTSGLRDVTGDSGDELGTLSEIRVRWDIVPRNLRLEVGYAYLNAGDFISDAPNATTQGDVNYGYVGLTLFF